VAYSPDGKYLVSGGEDKKVNVWNASSGEHLKTLEGHAGLVMRVAYSPNGKWIASASWDETINLWDASSANLVTTLKGHAGWIYGLTFDPDGKHIVSGSVDRTIKVWRLDERFSSDGAAQAHHVITSPYTGRIRATESKVSFDNLNTSQETLALRPPSIFFHAPPSSMLHKMRTLDDPIALDIERFLATIKVDNLNSARVIAQRMLDSDPDRAKTHIQPHAHRLCQHLTRLGLQDPKHICTLALPQ